MRDDVIEAALGRLAGCHFRFPVVVGRDAASLSADGWVRADATAGKPFWRTLEAQRLVGLDDPSDRTERIVGASIALQLYVGRLAGLALGVWVQTGALLDVAPQQVWLRLDGQVAEIALPAARVLRDDAPVEAVAAALLDPLPPTVAAARAVAGISDRVAWGNVAAACALDLGVLDQAVPSEARGDLRRAAERFLAAPQWPYRDLVALERVPVPSRGIVLDHARRTCCLMRLLPRYGPCPACSRLTDAERLERHRRNLSAGVVPGRLPSVGPTTDRTRPDSATPTT